MAAWIKRLAYLLTLLAALGGTILATMPVQLMALQFQLPETVRIGHLAGTVWSGRAHEVAYLGKIGKLSGKDQKMDLAWEWCPGWKQGLAATCVNVNSPLLKGEGTLAYSLWGGGLSLFDARVLSRIPSYPVEIESLKTRLEGEGVANVERLSLDFDDLRLLTALRADGEVRELSAGGISLGDYLWRASSEDGAGLTSEFSGGGDRFQVKGRASLNLDDRAYRYTAEMRSEDRGLLDLLKGKAQKAEAGKLIFSGDGKFQPGPRNAAPNRKQGKP